MSNAKEESISQRHGKYHMGLGTNTIKKIGGMTCTKSHVFKKPTYSCNIDPKNMDPQALYNMFYDVEAKMPPRDPDLLGAGKELVKEFAGLKCSAITPQNPNAKPFFDCEIKVGDSESASELREKYNVLARELEHCQKGEIKYGDDCNSKSGNHKCNSIPLTGAKKQ